MSNRIAYIDIARGLGILLVVLGHNEFVFIAPFAYQVIYSFHMPLFFFLSGYFINTTGGFWNFAVRRFNLLLKPYLFVIFMIYFASISFGRMGFENAFGRIVKSLYDSGYYIDWVQLWFLPHLFVVSLYAFFFHNLFETTKWGRPLKWIALVATLWIASLFLPRFYPFPLTVLGKDYNLYGLPFSLDLLFLSGFFYILGGEIRRVDMGRVFASPFFLAVTGLSVVLLNFLFYFHIDFNTRVYESFVMNTVQAVIGILFVLALSYQIARRTQTLAAFFTYFGQISMTLLIFHVPIQDFWAQKILAVTSDQPLSIWCGFFAGVAGSVLIHELFVKANPVILWWFGRKLDTVEQKADVSKQ
jgi:fucose 4-O-acetylase-like acetyltransferase